MRWHLFVATAAAVAVMLALDFAPLASVLRYERAALSNGELWRLWTAHLVHLNLGHTLLNAAGLVGVMLVVGEHLRVRAWLVGLVVTAPVVTAALWLFNPALPWYVGLSGMLHGLIVTGALAGLMAHGSGWSMNLTVLLVVGAKLMWEQLVGAMPGSIVMSGGRVIVDAHLFGAATGVFWGGVHGLRCWVRGNAR